MLELASLTFTAPVKQVNAVLFTGIDPVGGGHVMAHNGLLVGSHNNSTNPQTDYTVSCLQSLVKTIQHRSNTFCVVITFWHGNLYNEQSAIVLVLDSSAAAQPIYTLAIWSGFGVHVYPDRARIVSSDVFSGARVVMQKSLAENTYPHLKGSANILDAVAVTCLKTSLQAPSAYPWLDTNNALSNSPTFFQSLGYTVSSIPATVKYTSNKTAPATPPKKGKGKKDQKTDRPYLVFSVDGIACKLYLLEGVVSYKTKNGVYVFRERDNVKLAPDYADTFLQQIGGKEFLIDQQVKLEQYVIALGLITGNRPLVSLGDSNKQAAE